jgi:hypothetical protein
MKISFVCALLMAVSSALYAHKITNVACLFGHFKSVKVVSIEYTSQATVLTFKTTETCTPTLKIGGGIYIVDDNGQRHHSIGTEGIKLDSLYVMVKGQTRKFSISFEPVDANNKFIDVRSEQVRLHALYDARDKPEVPVVEDSIDDEELHYLTSGVAGYVEVDGMFHGDGDVDGTVLYFDYDGFILNPLRWADQYVKVDKDGHFKARFKIDSPAVFPLRKGYRNIGEYLGMLYLRPGDKLHIEVRDCSDGMDITCTNLSGREAYNRFANVSPSMLSANFYEYRKDFQSRLTYMGYDAHYADLQECYKKDMEFANYLCWHNGFTPFESRLCMNSMKEMYLGGFLSLDIYVGTLLSRARQDAEYARVTGKDNDYEDVDTTYLKALRDSMDYAYLKLLDPTDVSLMTDRTFKITAGTISQLKPLAQCHDAVAKDDANRWMKIIDLQRKELERFAGWTDIPFVMQMMIVSDYLSVFDRKPADENQYQQVRALLTNLYCKQYLDGMHKDRLEKASAK